MNLPFLQNAASFLLLDTLAGPATRTNMPGVAGRSGRKTSKCGRCKNCRLKWKCLHPKTSGGASAPVRTSERSKEAPKVIYNADKYSKTGFRDKRGDPETMRRNEKHPYAGENDIGNAVNKREEER